MIKEEEEEKKSNNPGLENLLLYLLSLLPCGARKPGLGRPGPSLAAHVTTSSWEGQAQWLCSLTCNLGICVQEVWLFIVGRGHAAQYSAWHIQVYCIFIALSVN